MDKSASYRRKVNKFQALPTQWQAQTKTRITERTDHAIVGHFQTVYRGFAEYYHADRSLRLKRVKMVRAFPMMTLANKHDSRISKIYRK